MVQNIIYASMGFSLTVFWYNLRVVIFLEHSLYRGIRNSWVRVTVHVIKIRLFGWLRGLCTSCSVHFSMEFEPFTDSRVSDTPIKKTVLVWTVKCKPVIFFFFFQWTTCWTDCKVLKSLCKETWSISTILMFGGLLLA
jgi:hypothetical protein